MGVTDWRVTMFSLEGPSTVCYDADDLPQEGFMMTAKKTDPSAATRSKKTGRERRLVERVLVDLEVDYRCEDTFLFAYITDISALGVFIKTEAPEAPGTRLNLKFTPHGHAEPLELEGEVIWINPFRPGDPYNLNPGMGVKFVDFDDDQRERVLKLVRTFAYLNDDEATEGGKSDEELDEDIEDEDEPSFETTDITKS